MKGVVRKGNKKVFDQFQNDGLKCPLDEEEVGGAFQSMFDTAYFNNVRFTNTVVSYLSCCCNNSERVNVL